MHPSGGEVDSLVFRFADLITRTDREGMDQLLTEDAVVVGIGKCKGRPCAGKADIRDRFIPRMMPPKPFSVVITRREGSRVWANWTLALPAAHAQLSDTARGNLIITGAGTQISRVVFNYDLTDPASILARVTQGELPFALQAADRHRNTSMRVLLTPFGAETAVAVFLNDDAKPGATAAIYHGTCAELGDEAFQLSAFEDDRSDTMIAIDTPALTSRATAYSVVVHAGDGSVCGCGKIPTPHPST